MILKRLPIMAALTTAACCAAPVAESKHQATPVEFGYVAEQGKSCSPDTGNLDGCVKQINGFQKKYWRLALVPDEGITRPGYTPPTTWQSLVRGIHKSETIVASSLYVERADASFEVPLVALKITNNEQANDTLPKRPQMLTPWFLGARDAVVDANVAPMTTLVSNNTSNFVDVARGAVQVVALFNPVTAAVLALPSTKTGLDGLSRFEERMNEARAGSHTLTAQLRRIYPQYLRDITVYEQNVTGEGSKQVLYRVRPVTRDSLFVTSVTDDLALSNIQRIKVPSPSGQAVPPSTTAGQGANEPQSVQLLSLLSTQFPIPATGQISTETCDAVLAKLSDYEYNELDSSFITAAWLSTKGWDTTLSRRDPDDHCYHRVASGMSGTTYAARLLKPRDELDRTQKEEEQESRQNLMATSRKFFDEITVLLDGKNTELSKTRFADSVTISAGASAPELDTFFDADLAKAPRVAYASDLAAVLASPEKPYLYYKRSSLDNCYQLLPNTVSSTVQARCFYVQRADGTKQRYSVMIGLDRSLSDTDGADARIVSIQFQQPL
ncbi:hypothetical protein [Cupriavidus sp. PET2-C1]